MTEPKDIEAEVEAQPEPEAEPPPDAEAQPEVAADAQADAEASAPDPDPAEPEPQPQTAVAPETPEEEIASLLGPDVRTPVGIPRDYKPTDSSIHEMFRVDLPDFAGPLDLLLYLIRKHELDIFDIPIKFITEKYLQMVEALKALEVDVAAEFLVLAAELLHIKSKMLLPVKEGVAVEDEEEEGDPRAELVRRLLEYQKYRDAAHQLSDRDQLGRDIFARNPPTLEMVDDLDPGLKSVSIFKLVELMAKLLRRAPVHHEIRFETVSIAERIHYVQAFGEAREGKFTLVQLLDGIMTRGEIVVTFIAVLEMTKLGIIRIMMEDLPAWRSSLPKKNDAAPSRRPEPVHLGDDVPDEEEPLEIPEPADEGSAAAARRLAEELEAEAPELEAMSSMDVAEGAEGAEANGEGPAPLVPSKPLPAPASEEDPLPDIWIKFTGKRFEGDLLDDYQ